VSEPGPGLTSDPADAVEVVLASFQIQSLASQKPPADAPKNRRPASPRRQPMTSLATTASTPVSVQRRRTRATLLTAAAVAAGCALVDLLAPPSSGSHLSTAADYAFTALLFPFVLAMIAVITMLHRMQDGKDGRLGKAGQRGRRTLLSCYRGCTPHRTFQL
jgi:hypothetical protein